MGYIVLLYYFGVKVYLWNNNEVACGWLEDQMKQTSSTFTKNIQCIHRDHTLRQVMRFVIERERGRDRQRVSQT